MEKTKATNTGFFTTIEFTSDDEDSEQYLERMARKEATRPAQSKDPEEIARYKKYEPYNKKTKLMGEKLKIGDYNTILNELTNLIGDFEKNKATFDSLGYPPHFYKTLLDIENNISNLTSKDKTRISKEGTKALSKLKQKVKKLLEDHSEAIDKYKDNPMTEDIEDADENEESNEEDYESEDEDEEESKKSSESESDDGEWDEDDEEGNQVDKNDIASMTREERRKLWLKDPEEKNKPQQVASNVRKQKEQVERIYRVQDITKDYSNIELSEESIHRRLNEIANNRSQMAGERLSENIDILLYILNQIRDQKRRLEIIIVLLNLKGEQMRSEAIIMDHETWLEYFEFIQEYHEMISSQKSTIKDNVVSYLKGEDTRYEKKELESLLVSLLTTLDSDWFTLIKTCDPESVEYAKILREELKLSKLLRTVFEHFRKSGNAYNTGFMAYKLLEHIYFLPDHVILAVHKSGADYVVRPDDGRFVESLTKMIYNKVTDSMVLMKTALMEAFNHAINDRYGESRDLLLMYNLGEKSSSDLVAGSYYNRALTALGLCAFRKGQIEDCQEILDDICNSGRIRELLNQASLKGYSEREEKRSLVPYHMSISLESIESSYFVSVMLNEAANLSSQMSDAEKRSSSKLFQKLWLFYEKNPLNGHPENHRDLIYCATKELIKGEWQKCFEYVRELKIWNRMPNAERVKEQFRELTKRQAFKAFVSSLKSTSHVLKFERLAELFEMKEKQVISLTCQMIYNNELQAKIDSKTGCLVTGVRDLDDLESISDKINLKIFSNINLNEKLFDVKFADVNFAELVSLADSNQYRSQKKQKHLLRLPVN